MVVTLVTNGSSRRVAARYIGCSPSTITRTAQRNPKFAEELVRAEHLTEVALLQRIKKAGEDPRYWRAAAWLLERKNTMDFVVKQKNAMTQERYHECLSQFIEDVFSEMPERYRKIAVKKVHAIAQQLNALPPTIIIEPVDETEPDGPDEASPQKSTETSQTTQTNENSHQSEQTPPKLQQATHE